MNWTKPYFGVSHCNEMSDRRRASVTDYGTSAVLVCWYKGAGIDSAEETEHESAQAARAAGERWINQGPPA